MRPLVDALVTAVSALLWAVTIVKIPTLRRRAAPTVWLWLVFLTLAASATLFCPWAPAAFNAVVRGSGILAEPLARTCVSAAAFCAQSLLREIAGPGTTARRRRTSRSRQVALVVEVLVFWAVWGAGAAQGALDFGSHPEPSLWSIGYLFVFLVYLGYVATDVLIGAWRFAREAPGALAPGLRLIAVGCGLGLGYVAVKIASIVMLLVGSPMSFAVESSAGRSLAVAAGVVFAAGSCWPAVSDRVAAMRLHLRAWQQYRQMYPLWHSLVSVAPEIALEPDSGRLRDLLSLGDLDFRVYRRVIEIRDARLVLRPYLDADVAARATREADEMQLSGADRAAHIESTVLREAVVSARAGRRSQHEWYELGVEGDCIGREVEWLTSVARSYRDRTRVVRTRMLAPRSAPQGGC